MFQIYSAGFSSPTPIQAQTWPIALQGRDIVAIAKTGSGKTLGYLIPAFILLRRRRNNVQNGPTVLVLAPTRELATQIQDETIKFGRSSRVSCAVCHISYFLHGHYQIILVSMHLNTVSSYDPTTCFSACMVELQGMLS